ncbi:MAG: succinate--CoA ligase subunit alpha [Chloroflexota bacterium]|nr:succinate--CoA ligase subunit alpha [Chloroflexota bacterium]MDE2968800.1 succinate--CoA ligase subunit alpha [Chloroflexota bacterium]
MSILVDRNSRVLVQGITGREGSFHTLRCIEYGTNVVAGVTPGRGGQKFGETDIDVYDTVAEAVRETSANVSLIFVPAPLAADAILESAAAGVALVVPIAEGIPPLDMVPVARTLEGSGTRMLGPNCPGLISPGERCKVGIMPGAIHTPGRVGVVSRSGTLTYEAVGQLSALGIGQSSCVGIGGDPVSGTTFVDVLRLFNDDPETDAVVLIGEIGGTKEQEAAEYIKAEMTKPVAALIVGQSAPPGKRMGHAGAIITGSAARAENKVAALRDAGASIIPSPADIGTTIQDVLGG